MKTRARWLGAVLALLLGGVASRAGAQTRPTGAGCRASETAQACFHRGLELAERAFRAGTMGEARTAAELLRVLEDACRRGEGDACYFAGRLVATPQPTDSAMTTGLARAARLFRSGCYAPSRPSAAACNDLADSYAYDLGTGVHEDSARAIFARGCRLGNATACFRWEARQEQTRSREPTPAERAAGRRVLQSACDGGSPGACTRLAFLLSAQINHDSAALGTPAFRREGRRVAALWRRACRGGEAGAELISCADLGAAFVEGQYGLVASIDSARHYYEIACRGHAPRGVADDSLWMGEGSACALLGRVLLLRDHAPDAALRAFRQGCLLADAGACADFAYRGIQLGRLDPQVALVHAATACNEASGTACTTVGQLYLAPPFADTTRALAYFERACGLQFGTGCFVAGVLTDVVLGDKEHAAQRYERACTLEFAGGCEQLAYLARHAAHPSPDAETRARAYEARACRLDPSYCDRRP